jgi:hypothetical protein
MIYGRIEGCFTTDENARGAHQIGGWVGPRAVMHTVEKRKISHCWESTPGLSAHSLSL